MRSPRIVPLVLSSFLLAALAGAPAEAGYRYQATSTTTPEKGKPQVTEVEAWVEGPNAKIVFRESGQPMVEAGQYLLTRDGGKTLYIVDPEEETYAAMDLSAMLSTLGSVMEGLGGMIDMEFRDVEVEKLADEPGGERLGRPVRHLKYRTAYTLAIKVFGMKRENRVEAIQDAWVTDALDAEGFGVWLRSNPPTGFAGLDELIEAEMEKVSGFPLETVIVSTTEGQKGKRSSTSRMETRVTALEEVALGDDVFALPAGYERVETGPSER